MASSKTQRLLLVEDDPPLARVYQEYLKSEPYEVIHAETGKEALKALADGAFDALVLDVQLPDMSGLEILKKLTQDNARMAMVVITAHGSINMAVDAMREGAADFLMKPFNAERLIFTLRNALERQELKGIVQTLKKDFNRETYCGFVGKSLPMQAVYRIVDAAAPSKATVFITGESGTGKEVCAEAVHGQSPRANKPFIALNCGAIPQELIESEIFGHVKGAFTGAVSSRKGYFELAGTGTIFLDEIGDTTLEFQTKLLRVLQDRTFFPVGGEMARKTEARIITATHQDLETLVEEGGFREDLYFRLRVVEIVVPPLRERRGDIPDLAEHLLGRIRRDTQQDVRHIAPEAMRALQGYEWPGNVRELENALTRASLLARGSTLGPEHLRLGSDRPEDAGAGGDGGYGVPGFPSGAVLSLSEGDGPDWTLDGAIGRQVLRVLQHTRGNKSEAARLLKISRSRLARLVEKFGLEEGKG